MIMFKCNWIVEEEKSKIGVFPFLESEWFVDILKDKGTLFTFNVLKDKFDTNRSVSCHEGPIPLMDVNLTILFGSGCHNLKFDYPRLTWFDGN
jgi:hypothetical protein